jgi:CRP/FNR family cyclic AMP-dependent transcriptional regulator
VDAVPAVFAMLDGASREAVAKAMHQLRNLGWIETDRRRVVVVDLPALRRYAG